MCKETSIPRTSAMKRTTVIGAFAGILTVTAIVIACVILFRSTEDDPTTDPIVSTSQGFVRGSLATTINNRTVFTFKGIPFAEPPIGSLRFAAPVARGSWSETLDATADGNECPQFSNSIPIGSEDCLHVNVYTPQLPASDLSLLPVLFYVYGGAFLAGSNNSTKLNQRYLLDKDIVLVIPNYRVGVFGFLSTGDETVSGNAGLKDLILALQWTRDNIANFGGDPDKVTVIGHSAGGAAAHLLTFAEQSKGLFRGVVTQSGLAQTLWAVQSRIPYSERAYELGESVGCANDTSGVLVNCLRQLEFEEVLNGTRSLFFSEDVRLPPILWAPTVELEVEGAFLVDTIPNLIANGKQLDLPWVTGVSRHEGFVNTGGFYSQLVLAENFFNYFDTHFPYFLATTNPDVNVTAITDAVKAYYFNNDLTGNRSTLLPTLTDALGDVGWQYPQKVALDDYSNMTNSAWVYSFEYRGTFSYSYVFTNGLTNDYGAVHGDNTLYMFDRKDALFPSLELEPSADDLIMKDIMVDLFTSFVINGVPSVSGLNVTWDPYSAGDNYLRIGNDSSLEVIQNSPFTTNRIQFWIDLLAAQAGSTT